MGRWVLGLCFLAGLAIANPKRPSRPDEVNEEDTLSEVLINTKVVPSNVNYATKENEEIDFGSVSWYSDEDDNFEATTEANDRQRPFDFGQETRRNENRQRPYDFGLNNRGGEERKRPFNNNQRPFDFGSSSNSWRPASSDYDYDTKYDSNYNNDNRYNTNRYGSNFFNNQNNDDRYGNRNNEADDEDTERLPYRVLEQNFDYELREYNASKWICTHETMDLNEDPYRNWRSRFSDGREAMREVNKENKRNDKEGMFRKLFKYIIGVNTEAAEIDMTSPVTTKRMRLVLNREKHEMCFWTGSPWANRELPSPIKDDIYVQKREPMQVFVRRFPGYALSVEDWESQLQELARDIRDRPDVDTSGTYYTAGYSGPWTEPSKRRNEVWIMRIPGFNGNKLANRNPSLGFLTGTRNSGNFVKADEMTELIEHETLETGINYEVRAYPASKWACTKEYDVDPIKDLMSNWKNKYRSPFDAMSSADWEKTPTSVMFKKLFKYIIGLNEKNVEIPMTRPVTTELSPQRRTRVYDEEMCFWLGKDYDRKDAPRPIDRKVSIEERDRMTVFVRKFEGFALSHGDIEYEYQELKKDLRGKLFDSDVYYFVSYNSPFTTENRRNEIWIQSL